MGARMEISEMCGQRCVEGEERNWGMKRGQAGGMGMAANVRSIRQEDMRHKVKKVPRSAQPIAYVDLASPETTYGGLRTPLVYMYRRVGGLAGKADRAGRVLGRTNQKIGRLSPYLVAQLRCCTVAQKSRAQSQSGDNFGTTVMMVPIVAQLRARAVSGFGLIVRSSVSRYGGTGREMMRILRGAVAK